jgi:hypothetical protein
MSQLRKIAEHFFNTHATRQVFQDILHSDAKPTNTRLTVSFSRLNRDDLRIVHLLNVPAARCWVKPRSACFVSRGQTLSSPPWHFDRNMLVEFVDVRHNAVHHDGQAVMAFDLIAFTSQLWRAQLVWVVQVASLLKIKIPPKACLPVSSRPDVGSGLPHSAVWLVEMEPRNRIQASVRYFMSAA